MGQKIKEQWRCRICYQVQDLLSLKKFPVSKRGLDRCDWFKLWPKVEKPKYFRNFLALWWAMKGEFEVIKISWLLNAWNMAKKQSIKSYGISLHRMIRKGITPLSRFVKPDFQTKLEVCQSNGIKLFCIRSFFTIWSFAVRLIRQGFSNGH